MKQTILLTLTLFFFTNTYSQEENINFQLSFGPTFSVPKTSKLTDSNIYGNPQIKSSLNIGAFILPSLHYSMNGNTSLDFGLGFYLDRFSIEEKNANVTLEGNRNVSQIQTPINLNFHLGKNNSYLLGIGGFASFLLSAQEKGESRIDSSGFLTDVENPTNNPSINNSISQNYDYDIKNRYNSVSFGAFLQLKKSVSFSDKTKGFLLLKVNQYLNALKNNDSESTIGSISFKNEKESTTINLGIGIEL
ncbi:hypothetical protein [Lacinutrix sp. Hel_I_90]|uniref:hypothetical protein n=1 Tax=Lacinutrix sp. Hel_I_90 TaxID=1249999 RepID=UPI0005C80A55|nr:hypothetical protein [Lacinutrix sp. Hel_I_90]